MTIKHLRKPFFCICENKDADQLGCAVTAQLISVLVFATEIVQSLYFQITKFLVSNHHLWLCSPVFVGPGRKPRRPVFSQRGSFCFVKRWFWSKEFTSRLQLRSYGDDRIRLCFNIRNTGEDPYFKRATY